MLGVIARYLVVIKSKTLVSFKTEFILRVTGVTSSKDLNNPI